jgi:hypothetical protein
MIGFVLLLAAACGGAKPEPANITIEMSEYAFTPETIELQVNQDVTLNLVNIGALDHEIMIGRDVMMMDNRPNGYQVDFFENAGVEPTVEMGEMGEGDHEHEDEEMHSGFMVLLPENGGTATMKFTVTEDMVGEWEMGCFEQEGVHYTAGMVGTVVVTP